MKRATVAGRNVALRPIERADIERGWLDWINDPEVNVHLDGTLPQRREDLERYYEASQPPSAFMFAICERDGAYIGNARLGGVDWVARRAFYGWFIGPAEKRGRGLGSEALLLLLRYGFHKLGLNRISTSVWAENGPSLKVNDRIGFVREGLLRDYVFKNGRFADAVQYSMLRREFDARYGDDAADSG